MPNILISKRIAPPGVALLRAQPGYTVQVMDEMPQSDFATQLRHADAVILAFQPLTGDAIAQAPRLQMVSRHGVGYDAVNVDALTQRRIPLSITPSANATAVAEHALALLFAVARRTVPVHHEVRTGRWRDPQSAPFVELFGKQALIVGAGRIGMATASRLLAFDMTVQVYDPFLPAQAPLAAGITRATDLTAALAQADVVSLHMPLTAQTRHCIDPWQLKRGAILINTARGGLVDDRELAHALRKAHLTGAGLDVFESEPLDSDHPLTPLDNVVLSPHAASMTDGALHRMSLESAQNVIDYFEGTLNPSSVVNPEVLDDGAH